MMLQWKGFSNYQTLCEEVELITDAGELKGIVRRLLKENRILSRKTNTTIQSLENQNILIFYLQDTISALLSWSRMAADQLCDIFGHELLSKFDDVVRCKTLINNMTRDYVFEDDKGSFKELQEIAGCVSLNDINNAKERCLTFLKKIADARAREKNEKKSTGKQGFGKTEAEKAEYYSNINDARAREKNEKKSTGKQGFGEAEKAEYYSNINDVRAREKSEKKSTGKQGLGEAEAEKAEYYSNINGKYSEKMNGGNDGNEMEEVEPRIVHTIRRRKDPKPYEFHNGRIALKKYRNNLHKKKVCAPLKHLPKSRGNRPENWPPKKPCKLSTVIDSGEKSEKHIIDSGPEELSKVKRRYKRRINVVNEENFSNSVENSKSLKDVSPEKSPPLKKVRSSLKDSSQDSNNEYQECRPFCISLIDILNDPVAESNELIAQFKQTYMTKDDDSEFEIVDDVDQSDEEEKADRADDNKNDSGDKEVHEDSSHQLNSNENDAVDPEHDQKENSPEKSPAKKDNDGKRGPRTPPPPSPIAPYEIFRRGPCTPPGEGPPDSDSLSVASDEDDQSNQSTKSESFKRKELC